jgi:hypothetical protein
VNRYTVIAVRPNIAASNDRSSRFLAATVHSTAGPSNRERLIFILTIIKFAERLAHPRFHVNELSELDKSFRQQVPGPAWLQAGIDHIVLNHALVQLCRAA